jgi:cysteinyl-tRNA synthetase
MVQCCAYFNLDKWSNFWLHSGHLHLKNDVKMSKSLSNTISIRELLKSYNSNDFRFFCLLSPYRNGNNFSIKKIQYYSFDVKIFYSDKEFSSDKMIKSKSLTNSFSSFIKYCQAYINQEIDLPKLELNEAQVFDRLEKTKNKIHEALCDDFNTCLVVEELDELKSFLNRHFQNSLDSSTTNQTIDSSSINRHYGCVMGVSNYIESVLNMFGIHFKSENNQMVCYICLFS